MGNRHSTGPSGRVRRETTNMSETRRRRQNSKEQGDSHADAAAPVAPQSPVPSTNISAEPVAGPAAAAAASSTFGRSISYADVAALIDISTLQISRHGVSSPQNDVGNASNDGANIYSYETPTLLEGHEWNGMESPPPIIPQNPFDSPPQASNRGPSPSGPQQPALGVERFNAFDTGSRSLFFWLSNDSSDDYNNSFSPQNYKAAHSFSLTSTNPSFSSRRSCNSFHFSSHDEDDSTQFIESTKSEWMGRDLNTLLHGGKIPKILALPRNNVSHDDVEESVNSEKDSSVRSQVDLNDDSSASISIDRNRRERIGREGAGPNAVLSLLARETVGRRKRHTSHHSVELRVMGGRSLFDKLDTPAGGIVALVGELQEVLGRHDWSEVTTIVSSLVPRLMGDGASHFPTSNSSDANRQGQRPYHHAGGGRTGMERSAFVLANGVQTFIDILYEPRFCGTARLLTTHDARILDPNLVSTTLSTTWIDILDILRALCYSMPELVLDHMGNYSTNHVRRVDRRCITLAHPDFLVLMFTMLSHDSCFESCAAVIEEILSIQSQASSTLSDDESSDGSDPFRGNTFYLGRIPDLYKLWQGFNLKQLAHFCRILAVLMFEPEDRHLLESTGVLKSTELLQLRRDRAARAGRESAVDINQSIVLGDGTYIVTRLLQLLRVMNYAPPLNQSSAYHAITHFPLITETLKMIGLSELENWDELEKLDALAKRLLTPSPTTADNETGNIASNEAYLNDERPTSPCHLGAVGTMLESLLGTLQTASGQQPSHTTHLGLVIQVITAAQETGVVGRVPRMGSSSRVAYRGRNIADLARIGQQALVDESFPSEEDEDDDDDGDSSSTSQSASQDVVVSSLVAQRVSSGKVAIRRPEDAANELQFNSLLLSPFQVEVLFVLCTLLGGRRKIDAQGLVTDLGIVGVLEDMFGRLSWGTTNPPHNNRQQGMTNDNTNTNTSDPSNQQGEDGEEAGVGIHGPGCECNPESAVRIQYLRLLHNFCDRDSNNYTGRRLLLSTEERQFIFSCPDFDRSMLNGGMRIPRDRMKEGLLSKVVSSFIVESDGSPYKFWLSSCVEAFLRGSSPREQVFTAHTGLLDYLLQDITSDRLHISGSLQTNFDLLGELCKGNSVVINMLVGRLDEDGFRRLMTVAATNLVDSNVFFRSMILSVERIMSKRRQNTLANEIHREFEDSAQLITEEGFSLDDNSSSLSQYPWLSETGASSRSYLSHSWYDIKMSAILELEEENKRFVEANEYLHDEKRESEWFPPFTSVMSRNTTISTMSTSSNIDSQLVDDNVGHNGWVFAPTSTVDHDNGFASKSDDDPIYRPNTIERLSWFLTTNRTRLLRDLLDGVDLRNINHENICCLNSAVVITIFAHRHMKLSTVLDELRDSSDIRNNTGDFSCLEINGDNRPMSSSNNVLRNFRELLWFWSEYYAHRGRDRLSLEFSSHLRFQEWKSVVSLLCADDGSKTSLVSLPIQLPKSPYSKRSTGNHSRSLEQ